MDLFRSAEKLMRMDDATWVRHANPWSVWTRLLTVVPLVSLAVWSRDMFGWYALIPIAISLIWVWLNPRVFPPPNSTDHWAARGILGERIFLERRRDDIAEHHVRAVNTLTLIGVMFSVVWMYGLITLDAWATITGTIGIVMSKAWFVDRMAWVFADMKRSDARYSTWLK